MGHSNTTNLGSSPSADADYVRSPDRTGLRRQLLPLLLMFVFLGVAGPVISLANGSPWWAAPALALFFAFGGARVAQLYRHEGEPLRINGTSISFPTTVNKRRNTEVIALSEITGVGLLFLASNPRFGYRGWYLMIWKADRPPGLTQFSWVPTVFTPGSGATANIKNFDPVVGTNPAVLENSHAATVAKEIYARVYAAQGPNGPLATRALERHPSVGRRTGFPVKAWWSPADGTLGYPTV